jgi:thymidine kinase
MGYLRLTFGPMFSGKTTNLVEQLNNYITYKKIKNNTFKALIINSNLDNRDKTTICNLTTHNNVIEKNIKSENVDFIKTKNLCDLSKDYINKYDYIAIDESQFFNDLDIFVPFWLKKNKYIHCVGLIADTSKNIFGKMHNLFCMADEIEQLKAYCVHCQNYEKNAIFTKWNCSKNKNSLIDIGDEKKYIPVCGKHF